MVEPNHTDPDETTDKDPEGKRSWSRLEYLVGKLNADAADDVDVTELLDGNGRYELRREVFDFAETFKNEDANRPYSIKYNMLLEETTLSEREAQVAVMKAADFTHAAIVLFYRIMDAETPEERAFPTSITTINEYSQRGREKWRRAQVTADQLRPIFGQVDFRNEAEADEYWEAHAHTFSEPPE